MNGETTAPIVVQAKSVADAERMAKDFAKVPRVGRGGEHVLPSEINPSSRGPNWQANLEAQQQHGRPEQIGRRLAPAQSGPTAPNQYQFHADGHGSSAGTSPAHDQSHFHARNARGEQATFLTGQAAQPNVLKSCAKMVGKALPAVGVAMVTSSVAAAEPGHRAQEASAGIGSLALGVMAAAAAVSFGAPVAAVAGVAVAAGYIGSVLGAKVFTPVPYQPAVPRLRLPPPAPPGCGWTPVGNSYYRTGPAGSLECWTSNGFSGYTTCTSRVGGVKLDIADVSQLTELDFDKPGDPVSVSDRKRNRLTYRSLEYTCLGITDAELATAVHLVFLERARDIAVSLDPDNERNCMLKVFAPPMMGQTAFGRVIMEADVILKQLIREKYEPVSLAARQADDATLAHAHVYFTCTQIHAKVDKHAGIVEFVDNDIVVVARSKTAEPISVELEDFVRDLNASMSDFVAKHPAIAATKRYMALIMMCKLLFQASRNTFTQELDLFVQQNMELGKDPYEYTVPMHETTRQIGNKIIGIRGGVQLVSQAMNLARPWRLGNPEEDTFTCRACGYTIEPYMEKALIGKQALICQDCREEAKLDLIHLQYDGPSANADAATRRIGNALKHEDFSPILDKITIADVPQKHEIVLPRLALLGIQDAQIHIRTASVDAGGVDASAVDAAGVLKYELCSFVPVVPDEGDLDRCRRCSWDMKQLREMSASEHGMICFTCRQELGLTLYKVQCARLVGAEPALPMFNHFLSRFRLSANAQFRDRDLEAILTTFLREILDDQVRGKFIFTMDQQRQKLNCEISLSS